MIGSIRIGTTTVGSVGLTSMMTGDRRKLYDDPNAFFDLDGHAVMKLTRPAAIEVCRMAASRGFLVVRWEGGIWHCPGFEARLDAIWDGLDPPVDIETAERNNARAAQMIVEEPALHDTFIITTAFLKRYRHLPEAEGA